MFTTPNRHRSEEVATPKAQPAVDGLRIFLLPQHVDELVHVALVLVLAHLAVDRAAA